MNDERHVLDAEDAWVRLNRRLEPLNAVVPASIPSWRPATLGFLAMAGVALTMVPAALVMMLIERWLTVDAEQPAHGVALGAFVFLWGLLSLALLSTAARLTIGRAGQLARRDLALAGAVLLAQGAWVAALHAWNVGVAGKVELDLIGRGTYVWPAVVIFLVVILPAVRLVGRRLAAALLVVTGIGILLLLFETISNALGAVADGEVSAGGVAVGVLSTVLLMFLCYWWWNALRPRVFNRRSSD